MKILNYFLALALLVSFSSCEKDDEIENSISKTIEIDATDMTSWAYFSFDKGAVVYTDKVEKDAEYKTKLDWDIAFHRMDVKLNGGESGAGKAEAFLMQEDGNPTLFTSIKQSPEATFTADIASNIMVGYGEMMSGGSPDYAASSKSETLGQWVSFGRGANGPKYTVKNQIFIVKTASGKYVKLWIKGFHNAAGKGGHITIQYEYQADGGRVFSE